MIVDTSVIVAILQDEDGASWYAEMMAKEPEVRLSAASYLEAAIVIDGTRKPRLSRQLDVLIEETEMTVEAVTAHQAHIARVAYQRFGKGSGHPARLDFGDCFAYALAKDTGEPLLFVGNDFVHTDVRTARDTD